MVSFQGGPGFWVPGELNPVDWCTKTRKAEELMSYFWLRGPDFLLLDISEWPIKFTYKKEDFEHWKETIDGNLKRIRENLGMEVRNI